MRPDGFQLILAHEIEHALQDQNFGFPDMDKLPDDDARLARMALYEGDAMATMTAVAARRAHQPVKLALGAAATAMRSLTAAQIVQASGYSPELLQAPAVVREELATPYVAGMALVAEVHRRGGFALVDKMFRKPPLTTHQVLHPDAYLAGELPARVPFPPGPPDVSYTITGTTSGLISSGFIVGGSNTLRLIVNNTGQTSISAPTAPVGQRERLPSAATKRP